MLRCPCKGKGMQRSRSRSKVGAAGGGVAGDEAKMQVAKPEGIAALIAALSPKNLFKGFKKNYEPAMPKAERSMKAAILIQKWYRRYMARMEVKRRYTWTIFQNIEYQGEQDQVKLYNFFNALLTLIPAQENRSITSEKTSETPRRIVDGPSTQDRRLSGLDDVDSPTMPPDNRYKGVHVGNPITSQDAKNLIETFQKEKHRLHAKYISSILKQAVKRLKTLPNLNEVSTLSSKQVTICGDLHGKLDDLLVVFHKNGLPSAENPYIFNGDFVDRGKKGLEVLLLLLVCLLAFPDGVFLNRGNHEDHVMNTRYGFIREVRSKYKNNYERLLQLIELVYRWLPLGTLVNNKVLVVHGGISDITDLTLLKGLSRSKYVSLLRPPVLEQPSPVPGSEVIDKAEWKQVFDVLWSDPQGSEGCVPNTLRGAGTYFGPDVTNSFLEKHNLSYLVRSHECKLDGYEITHGNKVITIFSASNYYETGSNKGAYMKLLGPDLDPHFVQFNAATITRTHNKMLSFKQRLGVIERSAIKELQGIIHSCKDRLLTEFERSDPSRLGLITVADWCRAMDNTTGLNLPWRLLRDKLVTLDPKGSGKVNYKSTFQEDIPWKQCDGSLTVVETLYGNKSSLEAIFRIIDKDNSGFISLEEFEEACSLLGEHLNSPQNEVMDMCKSMDINKDGLVDLNEFLETFRLVQKAKNYLGGESDVEEDHNVKETT
nr:PREDICTED: serine/threonine-protein phosphatase rdgC [Bemisia tabaci]